VTLEDDFGGDRTAASGASNFIGKVAIKVPCVREPSESLQKALSSQNRQLNLIFYSKN
jgi:hypothetical protein